jgi:Cu2+-exporting ATPase
VDQAVVIEIARESADSTVAEIHRLLARGIRDAPRYAVLAQHAATWFVAVVLVIAAVTAGAWLWIDPAAALPNTVAVLIVTCPCALALATPVAAAVGVGRCADSGMLTVRSDAIEVLAQCDTFAFDKTGTLTAGELTVEEIAVFGGLETDRARAVAASLEAHSEHPIGRALRDAWSGDVADVTDLNNDVGQGISGRLDDREWRIGRPGFALSAEVEGCLRDQIAALQARGQMVVALGGDRGSGALFALSDRIRPGARELLESLRAHGVSHIALLSGDGQASVDRFASGLDFDVVRGDLTPADKLSWIRDRQRAGARIAMLGDGINDAPTLAGADVSISFAHATELAQVNSGLLVLSGELGVIAEMRRLAKKIRRIIRQNLVWAASYNLLAVPAAALGFIAPWGAAIGMSLSSLLVVLNALRLRGARVRRAVK